MLPLKQPPNQYGIMANSQQATASSLRQRRLERTNAPDMRSRSRSIKMRKQQSKSPQAPALTPATQTPQLRYINTGGRGAETGEPAAREHGYLVRSLTRSQSENKPSFRINSSSNVTIEFRPYDGTQLDQSRQEKNKQNAYAQTNKTVRYYQRLYYSTRNELNNTLVAMESQKEVIAHLTEKIKKLGMMLEEKEKIIVMKEVEIGQVYHKINAIKVKEKQRKDSERTYRQSLSKDKARQHPQSQQQPSYPHAPTHNLQAIIGALHSKIKTQQGYISILRDQIYKLKLECARKNPTSTVPIRNLENLLAKAETIGKGEDEEQSLLLEISID